MKYIITNFDFSYNSNKFTQYNLNNNFTLYYDKNYYSKSNNGIIFKNDENILDLIIGNIRKDNLYINESINDNINLDGYNGNFERIYINKKSFDISAFKNSTFCENIYFYNVENRFALSDDLKLLSKITNSSINNNIASELYLCGGNLSNLLSQKSKYVESLFNNIYLLNTNTVLKYNYSDNNLNFIERIPLIKNNKFDILSNIYNAYYNDGKMYTVMLTGGMDSRLGLSILLNLNLQKNLIIRHHFEDEEEEKCVIDICKRFDLTLIVCYRTVDGSRFNKLTHENNNLFNSYDNNNYSFNLENLINNFNIDAFSKFNILNTIHHKKKADYEYVIQNLSTHHKDIKDKIVSITEGGWWKRSDVYPYHRSVNRHSDKTPTEDKFPTYICAKEGEFYKGLYFQRQSWPSLEKPVNSKKQSIMKYACNEYNINLQDISVINENYSNRLNKLKNLSDHNFEESKEFKNESILSLYIYSHNTNFNRNRKIFEHYLCSPLADDELINFLYNDLENNNFKYYRNELFHYEIINHFYPELLNFDFYGQGNLYSDELIKKFNPKNRKHLHFTYVKNKRNICVKKKMVDNYKEILINKDPKFFEIIIDYYNNNNFKSIFNKSVLNRYLKNPLKYFHELSNITVCCILTSDKYWNDNNIEKIIDLF